MSAPHFEHFLARLYTDEEFLETFLGYPERALKTAELTRAEKSALLAIDREGLILAARSLRAKREKGKKRKTFFDALLNQKYPETIYAFFATRIGW